MVIRVRHKSEIIGPWEQLQNDPKTVASTLSTEKDHENTIGYQNTTKSEESNMYNYLLI